MSERSKIVINIAQAVGSLTRRLGTDISDLIEAVERQLDGLVVIDPEGTPSKSSG
jgi:hypothetical protein